MSTHDSRPPAVDRRHLLRGGAVLAGAAGVTVLGAALAPTSASAANGGNVILGANNTETSTTTVSINSGGAAALTLTNPAGPGLALTPVTTFGPLDVGEVAFLVDGPRVGVDYGAGVETSYLATEVDLFNIASPTAVTPERLVDTRTSAGQANILSSRAVLDSSGQLKAANYIDINLGATDDGTIIDAAFLNVTAVKPARGGFLAVYPPGDRPDVSTVNYATGQILSNGAFVAVGTSGTNFAVRLYTSALTQVIVDLTGLVLRNGSIGEAGVAARGGVSKAGAYQRRMNKMRNAIRR